MDANRQTHVALYKIRKSPFRFSHNFNIAESLHDFFPEDAKLHFGQAIAHATVNAIPKRQVLSDIVTIDDKFISAGKNPY